ncbi:TPA: hypothetical protein ACGD5E_000304 [Serratia marcescens]
MNTHEMEGFLRGQCVPRDLLVNESNAAYLVRKLSEIASVKAERDALAQRVEMLAHNLGNAIWGEQEALQRVNALAVENAALKDACGGDGSYRDCPACDHSQYIESPETPATSVALAAIRNEATARALKHLCDCQLISSTVAELKATELREAK